MNQTTNPGADSNANTTATGGTDHTLVNVDTGTPPDGVRQMDQGSNIAMSSSTGGEPKAGIMPNFTGERQQQGAVYSDIASTIPGGTPQSGIGLGSHGRIREDEDTGNMNGFDTNSKTGGGMSDALLGSDSGGAGTTQQA